MSKPLFHDPPIKKMGDVITGKTPETAVSENYGTDYMFITPNELHGGYIIKRAERGLSEQGFASIKNNTISGISVLVGCIGWDMGNVALCLDTCATNQQINSITNFKDDYNPYYVYYWLAIKKNYLFQISSVTRTPILNKSVFEDILIPMPEIDIQNRIVDVLSAIDRKISINNNIIAELEAMAKTIYEYWFVQFDFPDENGNQYRSSGGEMEWNRQLKREIPQGWKVELISKCCSIVDCLHSKKPDMQFEKEDFYLIQLENIVDTGLVDLSQKYYVARLMYEEWTSRIEVKSGDLIMTNAGRVGAVARIPDHVKAGIGRNMTAIRPISIPALVLYYFFASSDIKGQIKANTDSGSFFGSLNVRGIKELCITLPSGSDMSILGAFEKVVSPIRKKIEETAQENLELVKLRNWLLPMLMNGQARVE